jgi:hypothetical protein
MITAALWGGRNSAAKKPLDAFNLWSTTFDSNPNVQSTWNATFVLVPLSDVFWAPLQSSSAVEQLENLTKECYYMFNRFFYWCVVVVVTGLISAIIPILNLQQADLPWTLTWSNVRIFLNAKFSNIHGNLKIVPFVIHKRKNLNNNMDDNIETTSKANHEVCYHPILSITNQSWTKIFYLL